ncbi:MAG: hypothetical protein ACTSV1_04080 [Alphaproteobacteria bacterium]
MVAGWLNRLGATMLLALHVWPAPALGQQPGAPAAVAKPSAEALVYEHPSVGYLITVPPGVQLEDRGPERGVALTSRKGYLLTVQTGTSDATASSHDLLARLEARYLGPGRAWSVKLDEKPARIAGLDALEAHYEGAGSRIRVVVVRGKTLDYVFFFFVSLADFKKLEVDFNWVLENFQPAAADRVASETEKLQKFNGKDLGYIIDYPVSWTFQRSGDHAVVFSGKNDTPEYFSTVSIQNVSGNDSAALIDRLKREIATSDPRAVFADEAPFGYSRPGQTLQGHQFSVTYTRNATRYRQWTIAIPRGRGNIVHLWSYAAPDDRFARIAPMVGKMLASWTIGQ